ncbi:hypothetical protein J2Z66_005676 [Paenibacillus eucommiae]|uniref:DUF3953 domain-containing protein n=1 Tax=Paenibacillus eucommiae TaxID=1355755 RepID=A0ABS4J2L8_9BACL|nr:hypothetical protein [Paenibacillus eucommiae]
MKRVLFSIGMSSMIIMGGSFLIRLFRDGDFRSVEGTAALVGILLFTGSFFVKGGGKTGPS